MEILNGERQRKQLSWGLILFKYWPELLENRNKEIQQKYQRVYEMKTHDKEGKFPFGSAWARHLIMRELLVILICLYFTVKQPSVKRTCVQIFLVTNEPTIKYNYPINTDCCFSRMGRTLPNVTRNTISDTLETQICLPATCYCLSAIDPRNRNKPSWHETNVVMTLTQRK